MPYPDLVLLLRSLLGVIDSAEEGVVTPCEALLELRTLIHDAQQQIATFEDHGPIDMETL